MTGYRSAGAVSLPVTAAYAAEAVIVIPGQLSWAARQVRAALSPSSPAFRHAVRLAVVIPLATEISRLLPWPRGYWLAVTTVIVLKPDFAATASRGVARTVGTALGIIAPAIVVTTLHPQGAVLTVMIAVIAWLIGNSIRLSQSRAEALRAQAATQTALAERLRIARELHDIVAHSVSLMVVQANAGERLAIVDPESAAEAFTSISDAARQAEVEIGRLVELKERAAQNRKPAPKAPWIPTRRRTVFWRLKPRGPRR